MSLEVRRALGGITSEWSDLAPVLAGIMRTARAEAIEECIKILRANGGDAERLMQEAKGRG